MAPTTRSASPSPLTSPTAETAWPLAEALQGLIADAALRARLGARNRELALERYGLAAMVRAHEAVWRAALARG